MDSARRDRSEITKASSSDSPRRSTPRPSPSRPPPYPPPRPHSSSGLDVRSFRKSQVTERPNRKKKLGKKKKNQTEVEKVQDGGCVCQHCWTSQASRRPRVSGMDTSSPNVSDDDEVGKGPPSWLRDVWGQRPTTPPPLARTSSRTTLPVWHNEGRVVPTSMWLKESHTSAGLSALRGWEEAQEAELARATQNALEIAQVPAAPSFYLALFSVLPTQDVTFI